ncbi:MAG: hypothetical protein H6936_13960 [Burkholderiales bacterium]|nr:hypothetical protein [Nitrosomonas sp.]MCP5275922.1 hypothetical protein [Burkholderiales bacterium]
MLKRARAAGQAESAQCVYSSDQCVVRRTAVHGGLKPDFKFDRVGSIAADLVIVKITDCGKRIVFLRGGCTAVVIEYAGKVVRKRITAIARIHLNQAE